MAEAVSNRVQEANQASIDRQIVRQEIPSNPNPSHTTAAQDWHDKAKASGLTN